MKTKFYWIALLASAAMIAQANAGGFHGGGGGGFSGRPAGAPSGGARGGGYSSFPGMSVPSFGNGRMVYASQRYSSFGVRKPATFQHRVNPNLSGQSRAGQFTSGNFNRSDRLMRFSNARNQAVTNQRHDRIGANQFRNGNNSLRADWHNHVFAQHPANWHRDWDRGRDHWWNGHRCHFINGSWVIFDFGFDPWWPYWYPDYYAPYYYGYYGDPYGYDDPGYDNSDGYGGEEYYAPNAYDSPDQHSDSTVAAAQERLAQQGYYRGEIDGVLGPETRRAIGKYQTAHGQTATGYLTENTLQALGLRQSRGS